MTVTDSFFLSVNYEIFCPKILNIIREKLQCEQAFISKLNSLGEQEKIINYEGNTSQKFSENILIDFQVNPKIISYLHEKSVNYYTNENILNDDDDDTAPIKRAELAIPIIIQTPEIIDIIDNKIWGILFIYDYNYLRQWQLEEIKNVKKIVNKLAIAIERNILYEKAQFLQKELDNSQVLDEITGLANYSSFMDCLAYEWRRLAREKQALSLVLMAVDYEEKIFNNDLIVKIANIVQQEIKRPTDLAAYCPINQLIIMLPNTDNDGALWVNKKILNRISVEVKTLYHCQCSSSIISIMPDIKENYHKLLRILESPLIRDQNLEENIYNQNLI